MRSLSSSLSFSKRVKIQENKDWNSSVRSLLPDEQAVKIQENKDWNESL